MEGGSAVHSLQEAEGELPVPVKEVFQSLFGKEVQLTQPFCGDY